jgi:cell division protein FtsQ
MSDRKLNMKRVRDAMIWLTLIAGISALLFFSILRKSNAEVKTLVVTIEGVTSDEQIISEKEVKQILQLAAGKTLTKANIKTLNLRKLEAKLNKDKRIERADLYFDSKDRLNARIIQKKPIMRVIEEAGAEYYLDENGKQVPVTRGSAVRVPLVTGIRDTFYAKFLDNTRPSKLKQVFDIMKYVAKDEFLSALIEQAHVEHDSIGDIVLIPKLGKEKLIFGDATDIEAKFDNLKIFYRDGMPKLGWSRYKTLNLKYSQQVRGILANPAVATKIKPVLRDTLTAELVTTDNNKQSIQN